ncbi:MAG: hypothetical protein KIS77_08020 [Saprospiraceae bacterium]|nr:hypothetical protein [Saprospiraceae bacterium]
MQKQLLSALLLVSGIALLAITGCKKDDNAPTDPAVESAKQALRSQQLVNSSFGVALRGAEKANGLLDDSADDRCGSITITPATPNAFPKVIAVDFGTGCTDNDGKFKAGKVILTVGKIWEPNSEVSIEYDNYKEDGASLSGKFTLQNKSTQNAGIFVVVAENVQAADANGFSIAYDAVQTFTQTAGHPTWWDWADDVYGITGSISSVLTNGETVNWTIQTPLVKANNCYWVSAGTGLLDLNGLPVAVDYGDGTCDNKATITVNGQTYQITL